MDGAAISLNLRCRRRRLL